MASRLVAPTFNAASTAFCNVGSECFSNSRKTRMYSRVPSPSRSASNRRRKRAKHSGRFHPLGGRAWSSAPGLHSSNAR